MARRGLLPPAKAVSTRPNIRFAVPDGAIQSLTGPFLAMISRDFFRRPDVVAMASQLMRFAVSTGLSAVLSFGLPIALHEYFGVAEKTGVAIGFAAAYVGNIVLLRVFVFRSQGSWRQQLARFIPANAVFRLLEYGAFLLLFERLGLDYRLAVLIVLGTSTLVKFFAYRLIFRDKAAVG